jgi:hypothetical protein
MRTELNVIVFGGRATVSVDNGPRGTAIDARMPVRPGRGAMGDEAAPRVIFSDWQAPPVGAADGLDRRLTATVPAGTEVRW